MKLIKRKILSLISIISRSVTGNLMAFHQSFRNKIVPLIIRKRIKHNVLAIDIRNNHGIGSKLTWALELLAFCEEKNLSLQLRFSYPKMRNDYFALFFDLKMNNNKPTEFKKLSFTVIKSLAEVGFEHSYDQILTLESAAQLVKKNIIIKEYLLEIVDQYVAANFNNQQILGLHYRGTDKTGEAEKIEYSSILKNIHYYIEKYGEPSKLFVATDSNEFLNYILKLEFPFEVLHREEDIRSDNNIAVHFGIDSPEIAKIINQEALINCLILSRCSFLLKSSSFLSDWSKLFNPDLEVTVLNKPFDWALWFPGRALIENNAFIPR